MFSARTNAFVKVIEVRECAAREACGKIARRFLNIGVAKLRPVKT